MANGLAEGEGQLHRGVLPLSVLELGSQVALKLGDAHACVCTHVCVCMCVFVLAYLG